MALPIETDILMIGHFAKDILVVDGRAEVSSGGGVYYGSIPLRHLGLKVAVVTRLHPDDFARLETLEQAGVQLFATPAPETSGIKNITTQLIWNGVFASHWALPAPLAGRISLT